MTHPLVKQLHFARSEFTRGLGEVADPEAQQRFGNLNCISWMVGHLAWQEQRYWLDRAQRRVLIPKLNEQLAYGKPACTPPAAEMWEAWRQVTQAADPWLEALTNESIQAPLMEGFSSAGTFLQRVIYHYWYHLGEGMAVRQLLGHTGLPDFVGNIDALAPYRPEAGGVEERLDKAAMIAKVQDAYAKWEGLIAGLDDERLLEPGSSGDWSVKDVIAHISWHEREMVGVLQARTLAGSELWELPTDERNQAIYDENRARSLEEVRREAGVVHGQLLELLERLDEEELHDPGRFKDMPADWRPWDLLADNTYQHYLDHYYSLRDRLGKE